MPWNESTRMDERRAFVEAYLTDRFSLSELCRSAGVSRPTGYLWIERYRRQGEAGLVDRSHAAQRCPHRTPAAVAEQLVALRRQHPHWGPRKLLRVASRRWPQLPLPSRSATAGILRRAGLVAERRRRAPTPERAAQAVQTPTEPNTLWTIDFKGQFRTGDHRWCYPLTVADAASRCLLECRGQLRPDGAPTAQRLRRLFREQGLPECIHSDNGAPFASVGIAGLSRLSLEWLKLGIRIERSRPACPQDNASHERMHRTLKQATARPPPTSRPSSGASIASGRSSTSSDPTRPSPITRPPSSIDPRRAPTPSACPNRTTRDTSTGDASVMLGSCAGTAATCSSAACSPAN